MPELPEVETIKNILNSVVRNQTITKIELFSNTLVLTDKNDFINQLKNQTFKDVSRIGKYLFFHLTNNLVLISHLRMEGKYYFMDENDHNSKYCKAVFHLNNNKKLCYDDSRGFGIMILSNENNYLKEKEVAKLGPEPFAINDSSYLIDKFKNNKNLIKSVLVDQSIMAGIGNIYADEILYASKIHPHTPAYFLNKKDAENILKNSQIILNNAIKLGGSTIRSYHPGKDIDGNFQLQLKAYGKEGEICPNCGKTFRFTKTNGRGTTYCPGCQHKLAKRLTIAITGKIATGKSLALKEFAELKCDTLSCDDIVIKIYQNPKVIDDVNKVLGLNFVNSIDKKILRDYLLTHPNMKKRFERYIWNYVKEEIIYFIKTSKNPLIVVEVPLLFESNMDDLFDVIIVTESNENNTDTRLNKRDGNTLNKELRNSNTLELNKNKAEFIVNNNSSKEEFIKEIDSIFYKLKDRLN